MFQEKVGGYVQPGLPGLEELSQPEMKIEKDRLKTENFNHKNCIY